LIVTTLASGPDRDVDCLMRAVPASATQNQVMGFWGMAVSSPSHEELTA
jgi:hypothetical protein